VTLTPLILNGGLIDASGVSQLRESSHGGRGGHGGHGERQSNNVVNRGSIVFSVTSATSVVQQRLVAESN